MKTNRKTSENFAGLGLAWKLKFPDGIYSFWLLRKPGTEKRFIVRVKETGKGTWTIQDRHTNLINELSTELPQLAISIKDYTKFEPADKLDVITWLVSHKFDLYDLVEQWLKYS